MTDLSAIVAPLLAWYRLHARKLPWRENPTPYRVWISEIMLQQTRVETVKPYFHRFLAALPEVSKLAAAPEEELQRLWSGLGYYRRARQLQRAAQQIMNEHHGVFPSRYEQVRALPGIGDYTAGAILSIAFNQPEPAVDGNVLRVLARLTDCRDEVQNPAVRRRFAGALRAVYPAGRCGDFTQSLMELGAVVCTPQRTPDCAACPLAAHCLARARGSVDQLPVRTPVRERRSEQRTVLMLLHENRVALRRRPPHGLLAGLWEFPNREEELGPEELKTLLTERGLEPEEFTPGPAARHLFTHLEWRLSSWFIRCRNAAGADELHWVPREALGRDYPLPAAFRACQKALLNMKLV